MQYTGFDDVIATKRDTTWGMYRHIIGYYCTHLSKIYELGVRLIWLKIGFSGGLFYAR
jgi:hypothetical protein